MAVNSLASSTNTVEKSSMTAKGTILIGNGTEPIAFSVGANDRVLAADSSATNGVSWVTFTADSIPFTSIDAKGDLITATANDTISRLAIGSNGTVLLANSATATGLEWGSYPSSVVAEVFLEGAGTKNATVSIPAGNYLAKLSRNTSITVGGQTVSASSAMTFSNAQTNVSITGNIVVKQENIPTTWTTVNSSFGSTTINDIKYRGNLWVAAGYGGNIVSSTDGISWTQRRTGNTETFNRVVYGNGRWIATNGPSSQTSTDNAVTWTTLTNIGLIDAEFAQSQWVGVWGLGVIRTSPDGAAWTTRTSNFGTSQINGVAYGNGIWVAGGNNGEMRTSTNGITWTTVTSNFGTTVILDVTYGNGIWIAVGLYGQVRTSTNSTTWTTVTSNFGTTAVRKSVYSNGTWMIVGDSGQIRYSTDTTSWVTITTTFGTSQVNSIDYDKGSWIAVGGQLSQPQMRSSSVSPVPLTFSSIFYKNPTIAS